MHDNDRRESTAGQDAVSTPAAAGYRMPAEWEPHERCIIGWPTEQRETETAYHRAPRPRPCDRARGRGGDEPKGGIP